MMGTVTGFLKYWATFSIIAAGILAPCASTATPFTTTVPGENIPLPDPYPEAGGIAIVMIGANGNVYYQFSDPNGAFVGFQNNGRPRAFRGNPFTINNPIPLDCGTRTCADYFGQSIDRMYIRFSAYDGDTQPGGFDQNDISLVMNGTTVDNWSNITTELTNDSGTVSYGFEQGFGNGGFNTGWFSTSNQTLLGNILSSGSTSTQVHDRDPNDNYWDFRRGDSLPAGDQGLRTIAPGYEFEKTADVSTFTAVGQMITYTYVVTNIGSVDIFDLEITDDKIPAGGITCDTTFIGETTSGGAEEFATCTATYEVTQEDFDNQEVVNVAQAEGRPRYGALGAVTDTVTVTGPPVLMPGIEVIKSVDRAAFAAVGEVVTYNYVINNTGDTTLTDIVLTDDKITGNICTIATLVPQAPDNSASCSATYTVTQDDVDAFALSGTQLTNIATVDAQDPNGAGVQDTDTQSITGPSAVPSMTVAKSAVQQNYDSVNDLIQFQIEIRNTGNVTWPAAPTITDPLITNAGGSVTCPAGPVAPDTGITCTADYRIIQGDLDAEELENIADVSITVGGQTVMGQGAVTVPAVVSTGLEIVKRLPSGADTTFDATTDQISYEYVLTNTGTVTIFSPSVADDKVAVTCTPTSIAPDDFIICTSTAPYDVEQSDLDAGQVTNLATASGVTQTNEAVTSDQTSLTVNADQDPSMTLTKTAPTIAPAAYQPGLMVTYQFEVVNTGNVTITDQIVISDDKIGDFDCGTGPLPPQPAAGSTRTCSAIYEVTTPDFLGGSVTNRATASDGTTTSNEDTATIPQDGTPNLGLSKAPDPVGATFTTLTDTIDFIFTVTNTGQTNILSAQPITIDDPKIGTVSCAAQPPLLAPTQSFECTGTYSGITQAEIDAGEIINTATASFDAPSGTVTSPEAEATVNSAIVPAMTLVKTGPASFGAVGTAVTYTFALTNDTAQTIASAEVTDVKIPSLSCSFTDIAPFATVNCMGDYTVTQADLDAGTIDNVANATGLAPTGEILSATDNETVTVDPAAQVRQLSLDKTADVSTFAAVGEEIFYTLAVTNTGTMTLNDIAVSDPILGYNCVIPTLAPMMTNDTICRVAYEITQDDIDRGNFENDATATATGTPSSQSSVDVTGPTRNAAFTVVKTANDTTEVQVNQIITYSHVVTNTGNVTLENVTLTDMHTSASGVSSLAFSPSNVIATLAPDTSVTLTTSYTVTQDDIDAGADLTNAVTATATPPTGVTPPTAQDDEIVDVVDAAPATSVVKTESDGTGDFALLPSSETFTFEVSNDGNVTLTGFTLTDDLTGFSCALPDIAVGGSTTTCADGTTILSTDYTILQSDIDEGTLTNEVTVTDGTLSATDKVTLDGPDQTVAITLVKTATSGANFTAVDDEITYDFVLTNSGNVTITAPLSVTDDKTTVTCPAIPVGGIAPTESLTCTATYEVTQADLNAGSVTNIAQGFVTQFATPGGAVEVSSNTDTETVTANQQPSLSIDKLITPNTPVTFRDPITDMISYDFVVTNNGNVTIPGPITINDDQIGNGLTCSAAALDPEQSITCTHTWTATQTAIDAGEIENTASPVALFNAAPVPTNSDSVTALALQEPELTLTKEFVSISTGNYAAGEDITYRFTVQNTGNTTITTEPVISDSIITDPADITIDAPFPAAGLAPNAMITYTGTYEITLGDVQLGSVTNTATASSNGVTSEPDFVTTPEDVDPALTVVKTANVAGVGNVGDLIVYTYEVTNTSEGEAGQPKPAFANPITIADDKFPGETITCDPTADNQLVFDETTTCTKTYTVTLDDVNAGEVVNVATANTIFAGSPVASVPDTVTVPVETNPSLAVLKEVIAGRNPALEGDTITYRITATNDGDQTLNNVAITDPEIPTLTCTVGGNPAPALVTLLPGGILICEGTYDVTQDDVDAQVLENTATASASNPQGQPITQDGSVTHPIDPYDPEVTVTKTLAQGEPDSAYSTVGEEITFIIKVENTGNITLTSTTVTDSIVAGSCPIGELAPGESDTTCEFVYEVKQSDIDNGTINNTATAESQPATPNSDPIEGSDTLVSTGPEFNPAYAMSKNADLTEFDDDEVTITYTFIVANVGNITLDVAPTVVDPKVPSISCSAFPTDGLLPGEFLTCTGEYETTQTNLDDGEVVNVAHVTSSEVPFDPNDPKLAQATETVPAVQNPSITLEKSASETTDVAEGDTITYSFEVENTGNVTLTDVTLTDAHTTAAGTAPLSIQPSNVISSLAPDEIVTLTATYVVTQGDIDAGNPITNTVSLTAVSPDGTTPTATDDETVTPEADDPVIQANKVVASNTGVEVDDTVTFEITVTNTGNVTLDNIALADTMRRQDGTLNTPAPTPSLISGDGGTLTPDEEWTYQIVHTLTQEDIDAGGLSNSATAMGDAPDGETVSDISDSGTGTGSNPTPFAIPSNPEIEAGKTVTVSNTEVGETVTFSITATNTGNVTLTAVDVVSDTLTRADGVLLSVATGPTFVGADSGSPEGTLLVDEVATWTVTYVLEQDDVDAGGIENTATVTGTPPTGSPITDDVDTPAEVEIVAEPAIKMDKTLAAGGPTFSAVDQELTFDFTVTNTGNVTITDPITIVDPLITDAGGEITCPPPPYAPESITVCEGKYSVTQDDIDNGGVTNTATASVPDATPVTDDVTVPSQQNPALETVKTAEDITPSEFIIGRVVNYTYTVTNTGNVTLTDAITISDNLIPTVTCEDLPVDGLAPTQFVTCMGQYEITQTDVQLNVVTNIASATSGTETSPPTSETIPQSGTPSLIITKEAIAVTDALNAPRAGDEFAAVGDKITYQFTLLNSGEVSFANPIMVVDDHFDDPIDCFEPVAGNLDLIPTETFVCEAVYTVTQDDLDAEAVNNSAYAQTRFGTTPETTVTSAPDTEVTNAAADPGIEIVKAVDSSTFAAVDDILTYTFTITNNGNQTLSSIEATDPLIPTLDCSVATLAPMGIATCTGTYKITQADLDANAVVNTASVAAVTPSGSSETDVSDPVTSTAPTVPSDLVLVKTATPNPFGAVNSAITYGFAVTNNGPFTLNDVMITDPLVPGYSCTIATLNVGETNSTSCAMPYQVTQQNVDDGSITNEATATGETPFGRPSTTMDDITTNGPTQMPSLTAVKTAAVPSTVEGEIITFTLEVTNDGNVTLAPPTLMDKMERIATRSPVFLTTPFTLQSGDANNVGAFDVGEVWVYTATYKLTLSDINAGGVSNSVEATALELNDPSDPPVSDTSDDGVAGNGDDNPTLVVVTPDPVLDVVKSITTGGTNPGDTVTFRIEAANRGNVTIDTITFADTLTRRDGTDLTADLSAPVRVAPGVGATDLHPGEVWAWEVSYELTQDDVNAGGISNVAVVSGEGPDGTPISDTSSDDDPSDGNPAVDPTELNIPPTGLLDTVKTVTSAAPTGAGDIVTFDVTATNLGNVTLTDMTLTDTLTRADGTALAPDMVSPDPASGQSIPYQGSITWTVTYELTQDDVDAGGVQNTATATGTTPTGLNVSDVSDNDIASDGNEVDDPTVVTVPADTTMVVDKTATAPTRVTGSVFEAVFTITVRNDGNVTQRDMSIVDDMTVFSVPSTLVSVSRPTVSGVAAGGANAGYNGVGDTETLATGTVLNVGDTASVQITVRYDVAAGSPASPNTASVSSARVTVPLTALVSVPGSSAAPDILADKTILTPGPYAAGGVVDYEITFTNRNGTPELNTTMVDDLPAGMSYVTGSATIDGSAVEPNRSGRRLTWAGIDIPANSTVTITLSALLMDGAGTFTNTAYTLDSTGVRTSNLAEATLTVTPEAVFDCSDVIGKVFDDINGNGYQDPPPDSRAAITNQDYVRGKFEISPEIIDQQQNGEPGLAGVRLVTPRGDIITTDEYGRFSVPCALLPGPTGSNFTLKLDDRSLPTGYRVTTENPRTMRLTSGIMTELNFGATLANLVDIDLLASAFQSGSAQPVAGLIQGVDGLIPQIAGTPSVLRLTYYTNGESDTTARARLQAVEQVIRDRWRGPYRLRIETTIARVQ